MQKNNARKGYLCSAWKKAVFGLIAVTALSGSAWTQQISAPLPVHQKKPAAICSIAFAKKSVTGKGASADRTLYMPCALLSDDTPPSYRSMYTWGLQRQTSQPQSWLARDISTGCIYLNKKTKICIDEKSASLNFRF